MVYIGIFNEYVMLGNTETYILSCQRSEEEVNTYSSPPLFIPVTFLLLSHFPNLLLFLCLQFIDTTRGFAFQYIELEIFARDDTMRTQNGLYCETS